ncbi:tyrosine-type recombinase/integrase [Elizabethkingia miricola]|uniref:tyrosine-type recombinase/integrase n=4 Tax=Elizabethkingia miricola TaxID=172045 RepID=UPI001F3B73B0|nr:tyrosine-type recombinase/integrase [Elizabethkingia miricola]UIO97088.1 site-specific integrase [Elizabethkingia miricola]WER13872.1 tyrosine-type recombinase/integrase [Elizabethkingia miricola]WGL74049.1 tyrosine-type recombinase/integrase [Elizabethkingia miricola]WNG65776.1 site-specific integrase [Elizabethkingia miricola]
MFKNLMPNGCSYAKLFIFPNPKKVSPKDAMKQKWYVGCKFYDPIYSDKYPKGYFWRKMGLAEFKDYKERLKAANILLDEMQRALDNCYNPIPEVRKFQPLDEGDYSPNLYLIEALELAFKDHAENITKEYAAGIKSNLKKIKPIIVKLKYDYLKIRDTELKHVKKILDNCNLSSYSYNKYKIHLSTLFNILCANSCLIQNPCEYIPVKNHFKKDKKILTQNQFDEIYNFLLDRYPDYANYCQIFHMSGCRSTELLGIKRSEVNIEKQEFIITVKKRRSHIRETRAIIPEALPFWKIQVDKCLFEDDYLFGVGFSPELRDGPITSDLPGKYWKRYIQKRFNIDVTFYPLKHLFLDKIAELYGLEVAQGMAGHLNGKTTEIYTVYNKKRELERLKNISLLNKK